MSIEYIKKENELLKINSFNNYTKNTILSAGLHHKK